MARYTKRIRKRRQRTKKLKNIRKTKRYKIKRGGTGPNDLERIGITDRWSFTNETDLENFKTYIFGSPERADLWIKIMTACKNKEDAATDTDKINFYILTSGHKVIIIRILQLLNIDHLVEEVLCVIDNPQANPRNSNRDSFRGKWKYEVIEQIMKELYPIKQCHTNVTGAFIDDDDENRLRHERCSTIEFIHATGDIAPTLNSENTYRLFCQDKEPSVAARLYKDPHIVSTSILDKLLTDIQTSYTTCMFSDWDKTVSPWVGVLPFLTKSFKDAFFQQFKVIESPLLAS